MEQTFYKTLESLLARLKSMRKKRYEAHQDTTQSILNFMHEHFELYLKLRQEPIFLQNQKYQDYLKESSVLLTWLPFELHRFITIIENTLESTFYDDEWEGICWKRSALEALKEMYADTCFGEHLPEFEDEDLDNCIKGRGEIEGYLPNEEIPSGIPYTHWWWWYPEQPKMSSSE